MRTAFRTAAVLLVALLAARAAEASPNGVIERRLGSGITLIAVPNPWNRIVAVSAVVDAGSKYDPPELRGLARVTNEFVVLGTARMERSQLQEIIDSGGIRIGAYTTEDHAEVYAVADVSQLDAVLDVIAALVMEPSFDERDLARAQSIVSSEISRAQADPFEACDAKLGELLFGGHPYAFPPYGTEDGVAAVTREDVVRFHGDRYRGGGIVVAAVGDVAPDALVQKLGERFASCASGRAARGAFELPVRGEPLFFEFHRAVPAGYVALGFDVPAAGSDDCAALSVLTSALGDMKARFGLLQEALDSGLGDGAAGAYRSERAERGRLVLFASASDADAALDIVREVVDEVRADPVAPDVLARAKSRLAGIIALGGEPNLERARRLARSELMGLGLDHTERLLRDIAAVEADDLARVAAKYLVNPVTVILRPGKAARTQL